MDNIPISISITALDSQFKESIEQDKQDIRSLSDYVADLGKRIDDEMNRAGISLSSFGKASEDIGGSLSSYFDGTVEAISRNETSLSRLENLIVRIKDREQELIDIRANEAENLKELRKESERLSEVEIPFLEKQGNTAALDDARDRLEQINERISDINLHVKETWRETENMAALKQKAGEIVNTFNDQRKSLDEVQEAFMKVNNKYDESVQKHSSLSVQLGMIRKEMENMVAASVKSGDAVATNAIRSSAAYKSLQAEAKRTAEAIKEIQSYDDSSAPRLFTTEEDYRHVKELEEEIAKLGELYQHVTDADGNIIDEKGYVAVTQKIIELQQELDGCNAKAAEAAAALGDHLGGKAVESSTRLYELNATLAEQQKTYDDLVAKLEEVAQKIDAATKAGDTAMLKDLQLEYQHLAEQVENANNALQKTKGEQKDAASSWEDMLGTISALSGEVQQSTRPIGQAITSFSQLSAAFKDTKNPVATFRAAMQAMRGGMGLTQVSIKGVITSIKALGKTLLSNPFTAILMAIAAVTMATIALVRSIESQAEKQKRLNETQANYLDLLQQTAKSNNNKYDDAIKSKERELAIAKSANRSLSEQYKIEDELNRLKRDKAVSDAAYYAEEVENIDNNRKALFGLQKELARAKNAKVAGDKKITITVDGKTSKQKVDEAIENLQGAIKNKELLITLGVNARDAKAEQIAADEQTANERKERSKQIAATERNILRETQAVRISLGMDAYRRDIEQAKANAKNKIEDLKLQLRDEVNLTTAARKSINEQIKLQQQKLNNDLDKLERDHQAKLLAIRRQVEDVGEDSGAKTAQQQREALMREYFRMKEDVDAQIMNPDVSGDELKELMRLREAYNRRYLAERQILELQIQQQAIETEKETIGLRLGAVKQGTLEELSLRMQMLDAERRAELQANKLKPEDQRQSEDAINAKYDKQREDERKAFYASVIGDYVDYQQEMLNMTTAYEYRRAQLELQISQENDPKKKQALQKSLAELEKTYRASLKSLQQEFVKNNIGDVFNEQTVENIKEAKRALDEMEGMSLDDFNLAYNAHLTADEFENLKEQIRKVRNELRDMGKGYSLKEAFQDAFDGKTKEEMQRGVDYLVNGFSKVGSIVGGLADAMREFAEATNNAKLEKMADTFQSIADTISTAGSYAAAGASIGGGWGAVIGAVLGIGQGVITAIFKSEEAKEEAERVRTEEAHDYLQEVVSGIGSLIGSVNSLGDTIAELDYSNYRKSLLDAINSLRADVKFDSEKNWNDLRNGADPFSAFMQLDRNHLWNELTIRNWDLFQEGMDEATRAAFNKLKEGLELTEDEMRLLYNQYLKSGWGGGKRAIQNAYANQENYKDFELNERRKNLLKELNQLYKEGSMNSMVYFNLLMKSDKLSLDMLKQKRDELIGEGYALDSDEIIAIDNQIAEAEYNMGERLKKMFEGLAGIDLQSLANKWLDIFKEFGDNLDTVFDKIDESIDDMIENIIYQTVFIGPLMENLNRVFERYKQKLRQQQNLAEDGSQDEQIDWSGVDFINLANEMREEGRNSAELWASVREQLRAAGLGDSVSDRSAQARGIATASQESVDELNGRMTAVQGHTFTISENSGIIRDNTNAILSSVQRIEYNTEELHALRSDLHGLKGSLDSIITIQGIKISS